MDSSQCIVVMNDLEELEKIRVVLVKDHRLEVIPAQSLHEAMGFLGIFPDVRCVVIFADRINWKRDDTPKAIREHLSSTQQGPHFFWLGAINRCSIKDERISVIVGDITSEELLGKIQETLFSSSPEGARAVAKKGVSPQPNQEIITKGVEKQLTEIFPKENADVENNQPIPINEIRPDLVMDPDKVDKIHDESDEENEKFEAVSSQTMPSFVVSDVLKTSPVKQSAPGQIMGMQEGSPFDADYFRVSLDQLLTIDNAPTDIFIKIGNQEGESKYLKRFKRNDILQKDFLERCKQKGLRDLHVRTEERGLVTQFFTRNLLSKIKDLDSDANPTGSLLELVYHQLVAVHEEAGKLLQEAGLKEELTALASETVVTVVKQLEKSPSLVKSIRKIMLNTNSISYRQSYMTSVVAYAILKQFTWTQRTHYESMVFCSFFHDISLTSEKLLTIHSDAELQAAAISEKDRDLVKKHAHFSSEIIQSKVFPGEADVIIRQHHGSESGIGFPKVISDKIHRLAIIFLVSEAFTIKLLRANSNQIDAVQILKEILDDYEGPRVHSTIAALKKALVEG